MACLQSTAPYRGFVGGRGAGKSFTGAFDLLLRGRPDRLYLAANPTYTNLRDTTLRTFRDVAHIAGRYLKFRKGRDLSAIFGVLGGRAEVLFRSTQVPEMLRGPNLSGAWLDEASLMPKAAFDVAIACLREKGSQGWLLATYTPRGRASWTYQQFQTGLPDTEYFIARTSENPFAPPEFAEMLRRQYSERQIAQELDAASLEGASTAVRFEDLVACEVPPAEILWPGGSPPIVGDGRFRTMHELYMGVDVGRSRDRTVLWTWERVGDVLWCRECLVMHDEPFLRQEDALRQRLRRGLYGRCLIDRGAIGAQLAERMASEFPRVAEGVVLTAGVQGRMAEQLGTAFERRVVRVPRDDDLRSDFQHVGSPLIANGRSVVHTERDSEGHGDRFWAAALALEAADERRIIVTARPRFRPAR